MSKMEGPPGRKKRTEPREQRTAAIAPDENGQLQELQLLYNVAGKLVEARTIDSVYAIAGEAIGALLPGSYLLAAAVNPDKKSVHVAWTRGLDKYLPAINKQLGGEIGSLTLHFSSGKPDSIAGSRIIVQKDGIYSLTGGQISKTASASLEKLLDIGETYGIRLAWKKDTYAILGILLKKGQKLTDSRTIEIIARQASIALQKLSANSELQSSLADFRGFFDKIKDLFFILDLDGGIIEINGSVSSALGYARKELIGRNILTLHPQDRRKEADRYLKTTLKGGAVVCPVPIIHKKGEIIPVFTSMSRGTWNGNPVIFKHAKDLSELHDLDELFRIAFNDIPSPILISDLKTGILLEANQAMVDIYKYDNKNDILGKTAIELGLYDNPADRGHIVRTLLKHGSISKYRLHGRTRLGELLEMLLSGYLINISGKKYFLALMMDITERTKAEKELRKSEERFRQVAEYSREWIWEMDQDFRFTYSSPVVRDVLGYLPQELVGKKRTHDTLSPVVTQKQREKIEQEIRKKGGLNNLQLPYIHKNGSTVILETNFGPLYDINGKIAGYRGSSTDVTARIGAENRLNEELKRFKVLHEFSLNMSAEKNLEDNFRFIVEKCRVLFHADTAMISLCDEKYTENRMHTVSGVRTEHFRKIVLPFGAGLGGLVMKTKKGYIIEDYFDNKEIVHVINPIVKAEGLVSGMAAPIISKNRNFGTLYVFNRCTSRFSGEDLRFLTLLGNLTAVEIMNKRAQRAERESNRNLSNIVNFLPDATLAIDLDGKVIVWSKAMEIASGVSAKDMLGKGNYEYALPFYYERRPLLVDLALHGSDKFEKTYPYIKKEADSIFAENFVPGIFGGKGATIWGKASPLYNLEGKVCGAIESIRDITEQKQTEEALRKNETKLYQLNSSLEERVRREVEKNRELDLQVMRQSRQAAMGEMLHNIAHQWRQPLNSLGLVVQNLRYRLKSSNADPKILQDFEDKTMEIILHMSRTIDDFKNFFKQDKVKVKFKIHDVVQQAVRIVDASYRNNFIRLEIEVPREIECLGYPNEMSQVFLNLLTNCKDAITERKTRDPVVRVEATAKGENGCRIRVSDNAGGMKEENLPGLFSPYFTTKENGTGIGLYMSKNIVEKSMGGRMTAENAGGGFLVTIEI